MTLGEVNAMDRAAFVAELGWVFEASPWVADAAWSGAPFGSLAELHGAMVGAVAGASGERQVELIRAHPDLGIAEQALPPANQTSGALLTPASLSEQSGAGLDRLTMEEHVGLKQLNTEYREKFGFPFIYAVKGSGKREILMALSERLANDVDAEHAQALAQIYRIAQYRLEKLFHAPVR
jgi:2-oxo-4-hydroxy-4-carboxy-5-ureidoimidazoline decarboxylase